MIVELLIPAPRWQRYWDPLIANMVGLDVRISGRPHRVVFAAPSDGTPEEGASGVILRVDDTPEAEPVRGGTSWIVRGGSTSWIVNERASRGDLASDMLSADRAVLLDAREGLVPQVQLLGVDRARALTMLRAAIEALEA